MSEEFEHFLSQNGIKHSTTIPYHPASNGLAERAVQIIKHGLKKEVAGDMNMRLAKILLNYWITPINYRCLTLQAFVGEETEDNTRFVEASHCQSC